MELGRVGVEVEVDLVQPAALVVGVGHLLAIGQGKRLGVEADGDAIAGDLSQSGNVSLKGGEEGLLVGGRGSPATWCGSMQLGSNGSRMSVRI